ncbi:MAG: lipocalin-like domain-containing protein [Hormoscilla sp. SP5CHS1]|nr:lipocalin-like domain-containing protein [Hormoscilla sp. SP12CHS1]MBC6453184.1 lipocalin-like domain-containing protein [Hormoscilla sp. SP5CHS1]
MTANRPKFATGNILRGSTEEKAAAAETYISYCGKYEIIDGKVIHHVEASLFPNWVGVDQERFFEFQGDRLSLSTPPIMYDGKQLTAHVLWERVSSNSN